MPAAEGALARLPLFLSAERGQSTSPRASHTPCGRDRRDRGRRQAETAREASACLQRDRNSSPRETAGGLEGLGRERENYNPLRERLS